MRNLGGAIGIALIDTVLYGRTSIHADALRARLLAGDMTTARAIGLDPGLFASGLSGSLTPNAEAYVRPMIEKAAFVWSVNDAWALLAGFALLGVLVVPFAWRKTRCVSSGEKDEFAGMRTRKQNSLVG